MHVLLKHVQTCLHTTQTQHIIMKILLMAQNIDYTKAFLSLKQMSAFACYHPASQEPRNRDNQSAHPREEIKTTHPHNTVLLSSFYRKWNPVAMCNNLKAVGCHYGTESQAALVPYEVGSEILHWQSWEFNSTYRSLRAEEGTEKGRVSKRTKLEWARTKKLWCAITQMHSFLKSLVWQTVYFKTL